MKPFASCNSSATSADRIWAAISRFYEICKNKKPGKKGYPRFQHDNRSVEYKTTGWRIEPDGKHITFTDGCGIGCLRLVGNKKQSVQTFPTKQIKRVRIVRRADGYYCQFAVQAERKIEHTSTGRQIGIDVGLKAYYTDSDGTTVENPRYYRRAEKRLKRLHRRLSRKHKGSANRKKARKQLAKAQDGQADWMKEEPPTFYAGECQKRQLLINFLRIYGSVFQFMAFFIRACRMLSVFVYSRRKREQAFVKEIRQALTHRGSGHAEPAGILPYV